MILANEFVERSALRWIARQLSDDPELEFFCLLDSCDTVRHMNSILRPLPPARPLAALVEVGCRGGRAGVRSAAHACEVAGYGRSVRR